MKIQEFDRDEYVVLETVKGEPKSNRFWLLFIPFGGKSDEVLFEEMYNATVHAAENEESDGLLQPRYTYKKTTVPLILFSWTTKKVTSEGRAFRIKSEEEYQETKGSK